MRPLRLELHNFGPYLGEHVIDFETLGRHGLFLIHGPTGAGKSCILDGLCFALFGKASGDERSGSDLASTLQEEERCKVVLEFEHRGKRYRITRSPQQQMAKQRGEGKTTKQAEATLEALDDGEVLATKVGEADNVVKDLLRCSVEQFRQTVVLPQGAFREVITNDGERREILANIFDTRRFADFSEALNEKAKELAQQSQSMQSRRAELLAGAGCENDEQLARRLELAEAEAARLKEELAQAATVRDERLREKTEAAALDEQFEEAEELRKAQNELDQRAEEMKFERERLDRAKRAALLADARTYLETTRKEREGLQGEVEGATGRLEEARSQLVEATRRLEEEKAREAERKEAQAACGRLEALEKQVGELADIGRQESELAGQVEELAEQAEMRREAVGAAEEQRTELVQRRASLAEKLGSEADLERRRGELQAQVRALREIERELARVASLAEEMEEVRAGGDPAEHLILAVREHSPGLLAASLAEGEACPVCGSEHHPLPAEGHDGLGGLQAAFERFGEAREEVSRLEEAERQHSVRASNLAAEGGWTLESLPELAERVEALGEVERAQEETRALREQLDELDQAVAAIDEELPGLRGQVEEAQRQQNEATGKLRELRGRLKGLLDQLEPENRDPEAFGEALERSRSRHRELQEAYESAREGEQKAQAQVEKREAELSIRQGQLGTAAEKLARLEEEFAEKLRGHGFDGLEELDAATLSREDLEELEDQVERYDESVRRVGDRLAHLSERLSGKERPDLEALQSLHDEAAEAFEEANEAWHGAEVLRAKLDDVRRDMEELERKHGALRTRIEAARKLADLARGKIRGRSRVDFETFVLQSIFHSVLAVGNQHLKHMTGGRYSLHLRFSDAASAKGLELDVSDHYHSGLKRPVHTLSGGEGFMASLSLALGLSEIAQRTSGGSELGALFIDEGFGSLDPKSLDQAVRILRDLPHDHRMVGVISHVEELKRRIPVQLQVEAGERGSRAGIAVNA